jgi:hypothetical protein
MWNELKLREKKIKNREKISVSGWSGEGETERKSIPVIL